jgi:hypothetical protein
MKQQIIKIWFNVIMSVVPINFITSISHKYALILPTSIWCLRRLPTKILYVFFCFPYVQPIWASFMHSTLRHYGKSVHNEVLYCNRLHCPSVMQLWPLCSCIGRRSKLFKSVQVVKQRKKYCTSCQRNLRKAALIVLRTWINFLGNKCL